jgi:hypothetical protein
MAYFFKKALSLPTEMKDCKKTLSPYSLLESFRDSTYKILIYIF